MSEERSCRLCLEHEPAADLLCDACACKGTQATVHSSCLRAWQRHAIAEGRLDAAVACGVCRARFTLAPPRISWRDWSRAKVSLRHVALGAVGAVRGGLFPLIPLFLLNQSLGVPEHEAAKEPEDDEAGLVADRSRKFGEGVRGVSQSDIKKKFGGQITGVCEGVRGGPQVCVKCVRREGVRREGVRCQVPGFRYQVSGVRCQCE